MKQDTSALKTTIIGGVVFLIPFVVLLVLAGKIYELMGNFSRPLAAAIGIEGIGEIAVLHVITVLLIVVVCYAAGRMATSGRGAHLLGTIDERLMMFFPRYGFVRAMASDLSGEGSTVLPVVMVRFDDQSQLGFEVERSDEQVVVFLPGSPDPWSGVVSFVPPGSSEVHAHRPPEGDQGPEVRWPWRPGTPAGPQSSVTTGRFEPGMTEYTERRRRE